MVGTISKPENETWFKFMKRARLNFMHPGDQEDYDKKYDCKNCIHNSVAVICNNCENKNKFKGLS